VLAVAFDLKVFFGVVGKPPSEITSSDVLAFISAQRAGGDGRSLRAIDDAAGLSARTVARRISTVAGLFAYLLARGDVPVNPVPRGLPTRRESYRSRPQVPLVRRPRTLPRILSPAEVDALLGALRTRRDVVMVAAMLLGGLRRCEVLGLRLGDVDTASKRVFIAHGKGGRQRQVAVSRRFFVALGDYLTEERPDTSSDALFVVLKGRRRGQPLSAYGLDEILDGARRRAGLTHATCHELRHTCLTGCGRPGWHWRRSKPRPVTPRWRRPASTCMPVAADGGHRVDAEPLADVVQVSSWSRACWTTSGSNCWAWARRLARA
jgi:integrase/recombinase XerD